MAKTPNKFTHKCKICEDETNVSFNIDFRQVYICEGCAATIFLQQASWYARQNPNKTKKFIIGTDPY